MNALWPTGDRVNVCSMSRRLKLTLGLALGLLAAVVATGPAAAAPSPRIGTVKLAAPKPNGRPVLLVPVSYPIRYREHNATVAVSLRGPGLKKKRFWTRAPVELNSGRLRSPDLRRRFTFVHALSLPRAFSRRLYRHHRPTRLKTLAWATASAAFDTGRKVRVKAKRKQSKLRRARAGFCSTPRHVQRFRGREKIALPSCGSRFRWRIGRSADHGEVRVKPRRAVYRADRGRHGLDHFVLTGLRRGRRVNIRVETRVSGTDASGVSVRAMGDSVTAGFGYYGKTGRQMGISELLGCKPGDTYYNDACSSNSSNTRNNSGPDPHYLPDYGLSRNISWAAQWANKYGITNYRNYAITGSAPTDWLSGGQFNQIFRQIQTENPDYIVMTMGANPLLSDMLFGVDNMGCAIYSDLFGDYKSCIESAFAGVHLSQNLKSIYQQLVDTTTSHIVLMQYHLSIPSSALAYSSAQIEMMGELLNKVIAEQAAAVSTDRITVISPPRFDVGIDMRPLYPSKFTCSYLGYKVDGPSVQSTPTQDELLFDHPLSFCAGPPVGPPWVISGDTGIHPSAAGYFQMASRMPPPG